MRISSEEVAVIYARACRAWYGYRASSVVASKIDELRRARDFGGVKAWIQVAEKLEELAKKAGYRKSARGENGKLY